MRLNEALKKRVVVEEEELVDSHQSRDKIHHHQFDLKPLIGWLQLPEKLLGKVCERERESEGGRNTRM